MASSRLTNHQEKVESLETLATRMYNAIFPIDQRRASPDTIILGAFWSLPPIQTSGRFDGCGNLSALSRDFSLLNFCI